MHDISKIRNFAIIAHVDHGKSTLADRFLELTGVVKVGGHEEQFLDRNPISRERGITIKLAPVTMQYGKITLNLIDTPGHVDFSYEVDRTLACVEGVILLVDCTQGVQAQTIANAYKAIEKNLVIIPVVNKVDMANAQVEKTKKQLKAFLGIKEEEIFEVSAKTGLNVEKLLRTVVEKIPAPNKIAASLGFAEVPRNDKLRALIFDSYYDSHKGVIAFIRLISGSIKKGKEIRMVHTGESFKVLETGIFKPDLSPTDTLSYGDIGYVAEFKDCEGNRVALYQNK